jgi:hypothetical protein
MEIFTSFHLDEFDSEQFDPSVFISKRRDLEVVLRELFEYSAVLKDETIGILEKEYHSLNDFVNLSHQIHKLEKYQHVKLPPPINDEKLHSLLSKWAVVRQKKRIACLKLELMEKIDAIKPNDDVHGVAIQIQQYQLDLNNLKMDVPCFDFLTKSLEEKRLETIALLLKTPFVDVNYTSLQVLSYPIQELYAKEVLTPFFDKNPSYAEIIEALNGELSAVQQHTDLETYFYSKCEQRLKSFEYRNITVFHQHYMEIQEFMKRLPLKSVDSLSEFRNKIKKKFNLKIFFTLVKQEVLTEYTSHTFVTLIHKLFSFFIPALLPEFFTFLLQLCKKLSGDLTGQEDCIGAFNTLRSVSIELTSFLSKSHIKIVPIIQSILNEDVLREKIISKVISEGMISLKGIRQKLMNLSFVQSAPTEANIFLLEKMFSFSKVPDQAIKMEISNQLCKRYLEMITELLTTIEKTEMSLMKLKKKTLDQTKMIMIQIRLDISFISTQIVKNEMKTSEISNFIELQSYKK